MRGKEDMLGKGNGYNTTQIVIAALNEEAGIGRTIAELSENLNTQRVLVIDGKSCDRTVEIAKDMGAEIVFQDGVGKGDAVSKALSYLSPDVDYVVLTDADYTYPAEYVPSSFYFGNKLLAFAHTLLNGVTLKDPLTGLRVIRAEILRTWLVRSRGFDIEVELNHQVERSGFKTVEVPIKYRQRLGEKKLKVKDGATILKRILLETTL